MAESRFDKVSKRLASRFSRRTVIKGAGVAIGAGAVASLGGSATAIGCLNCYSSCSFPLYESDLGINYTLINQSGANGCASVRQTPVSGTAYRFDVRVRLEDAPRGTYQVFIGLCNDTEFHHIGQITVGPFGFGCGNWSVYRGTTCAPGSVDVIVGQFGGSAPDAYWRTGPIPANCAVVD